MSDDDDLMEGTVIRKKRRRPASAEAVAPPAHELPDATADRGMGPGRLISVPSAGPDEEHHEDALLDTAAPGSVPAAAGQMGDPLVGCVLKGQYRVVRKLGKGGMGSVYLAHNLQFDEKVAVKFLHFGGGVNPQHLLARFRAEQETLRLLKEARIVKTRGDGVTENGDHFIVMELVDGTPLDDILEAGLQLLKDIALSDPHAPPIAPSRMVRIMIDVCIALEEAHAHGIVHRDLKPANLVVERSTGGFETTKVLDFGIAKASSPVISGSEAAPPTATGMIVGTVAYLSPEQANSVDVVPQSDLYSLGATAFHCLTGQLPFAGNPMSVLHHHVHSPVRSFSSVAPGLERSPLLDALEPIVLKLLEKRPEDRYDSATTLRIDLEGLLGLASGVRPAVPEAALADTAPPKGRATPAAAEAPDAPPTGDAPPAPEAEPSTPEPEPDAARPEPPPVEPTSPGMFAEAPRQGPSPLLIGGGLVAVLGLALFAMSAMRSPSTPTAAPVDKVAAVQPAKPGPKAAAPEPAGTKAVAEPPTPADKPDPAPKAAPPPTKAATPPKAPPPPKAPAGPKITVVRSVMATPTEVRKIRAALERCYADSGATAKHTVRLGGVGKVVVESVKPAHAGLDKCLGQRMPLERFEAALGGALELTIAPPRE